MSVNFSSFGQIYRAVRKNRVVKVTDCTGKEARAIAMHEADVMSRLKHPNIVGFFECVVDKKAAKIGLLLEYVSGCALASIMSSTALNEQHVVYVLQQTLKGLIHIHRLVPT